MPENEYSVLDGINSPDDLKRLGGSSLPTLCGEIREFLVENVSRNGGHLASNLGVVELSVALHRVFDTPKDHIVWDVGHQAYVHKILTGRKNSFDSLRRNGGISGFPKISESEHDAFGAGHSSTSLSAALGFAEADRIKGSDAFTVAVVGDGAFTGGMIHEALNNCKHDLKLIIIINENEMSISKNTGRFADSLARLRSSERYFNTKKATVKVLSAIPLFGKWFLKLLKTTKRAIKNFIYGSNYFENMGLYYLGPVDGNDVSAMEEILRLAKKQQDSVVVHIKTKKGKGYEPAENDPDRYHSMPIPNAESKTCFSSEFGKALCNAAQKNDSVVAITAAMCEGTGLEKFKNTFPERFFDVGIAEAHALTFASGLAAGGMRPITAIYSTFLQRAYDNIIHDAALQELPVCMCIDRAGLNPSDGPTHHGIFDVAFLSQIPGVKIYTPCTYEGVERSLESALHENCPTAIRYPRGSENKLIKDYFYSESHDGIGIRADFSLSDKPQAVVVTHGRIAAEAIKAKNELSCRGFSVGLILLEFLKPYDMCAGLISEAIGDTEIPIVTLEEEIKQGGAGMLITDELCAKHGYHREKIKIMAVDESFAFGKKDEDIYTTVGLSAEHITKEILKLI